MCEHCGSGGGCGVCGRGAVSVYADPRGWMRAQTGVVGRVCRALDLGIYDDPADALAHEGGNLSDAEWADVREWFGALVGYPRG